MKIIVFFLFLIPSLLYAFDHSHDEYHQLLKLHVKLKNKQSLVNYAGFQKNIKKLDHYLTSLSKVTKKEFMAFNKNQQKAFLINAYNAFTIKLILNHPDVESIKDTGSFFTSPWRKEFFTLLEEKHHLDWIEHERLRPIFKDPRIHFAVNCASLSCPSLANFAFVAEKLDQQLEMMATSFINNKEKNYFSAKAKTIYLSKIFDWYEEDFETVDKCPVHYILRYIQLSKADKKLLIELLQNNTLEVEYIDYDWSLNKWEKK